MKNWPAFKGVDDMVKNLLKSLGSVAELKSPSIRARHWRELMRLFHSCLKLKRSVICDSCHLEIK